MSMWDYVPGVSNVKGAINGNWGQATFGPGAKVYGDLKSGAQAPYDQAASGIQGIADQSKQFSDTQWGRQQEGLGRAVGAMSPSDAYFNNTYGGQNSGPGQMENAFSQYGSNMMGPTQTGAASSAYGNYMNQGAMTYGGMNRANGLAGNSTNYSQYQNQLQDAGAANRNYYQNQGQYAQPGAGENYYAQNGQNFNQPTKANDVYQGLSSQLYAPGRSEGFQVQGPSWDSTNNQIGNATNYAGQAQGQTRLEGAQGDQVGNLYQNANNVNQFSRSAMPQLQGPGAYENFVTSDINGSNPALAMERQEGLASLNQEMARRGHFNSGGADVALGKFTGTMEAKDYANRAQLAQQAQQMQLGRLNQGLQTAQAGSGETMAKASGLQGLATTQDAQRLDRQQFGANTALSAADKNIAQQNTNLQGQSLGIQAAQNADASRNARLNTLQGMATAGDQSWNAQQQLGMNAANQAQQQQLARLQGSVQGSQAADTGALQRLQAQFGMANQGNDQDLARAQLQFQMGQGADANDLARYQAMGQLGNMADTQHQNQFTNYMAAANQAQQAQQGRMADAMKARFGIDQTNAGLYGGFYNQGGQESGQAFSDAMNAYANAYGLKAQGAAAAQQVPFQLAGIGMKAFGAGG